MSSVKKSRLAERARAASEAKRERAEAPPPPPPSPALNRETAIASVLGGRTLEVTQRLVDPAVCRPWRRANRLYDHLTPQNCADLIDTIAIDGQRIPAIVRRLPASEAHQFEIVAGARRHYAVTYLREALGRTDVQYLIQPAQLTDEEAFRLSDYENRSRKDISEYERGRDYATALEEFYGGNVARMAEGIGQPRTTLRLYLALASLPDRVVAAYPNATEIPVRHATTLGPLLNDGRKAKAILAAADGLAQAQSSARAGEGAPVPPPAVLKRLVAAATPPRKAARPANGRPVLSDTGEALFTVRETPKTLELAFDLPKGTDREALVEAVRKLLSTRR